MTFLVRPDISTIAPNSLPEKVYLYETYSHYSWYMFGSTLLLFLGLMVFAYAMDVMLEDRIFQDKSLLKKKYTLYQRSILNKIFKKGNKKTNIPFDLKVLYLKPEYVDKFKVADLKITTEQTESSNLRLHRIEFVLEDKVAGMLLKKINIAALGEINNGKENINTLPYTKTILLGAEPIKKAKNKSETNKDNDQKFEDFYPEIKTKVPFSEIKNRKPDKKYSTKGKNSKKRKHHKNQQKKKY